jgi:leucyl aminopeptidase
LKAPTLTFFISPNEKAVPVYLVGKPNQLPKGLDAIQLALVKTCGFSASAGSILLLPDQEGGLSGVLFGLGEGQDPFICAKLTAELPAGDYALVGDGDLDGETLALALRLGAYSFDRYKANKEDKPSPRFVLPEGCHEETNDALARAVTLTRDLVNTPTSDMGPAELAGAAIDLGKSHGAKVDVTVGEDLLTQNLPLIHAVGRASASAPRLIDMTWGREADPKITLVGKGVCFDSGGLNLKPGSAITLMKKDMGGSANVLGLASLIMDAKLPVRLRVLIPAVENSVSGNAFRPGDVLPSRLGPTVEIENTDAEGRLILADALALGDEESPELMLDMATLTGAARVALGPELPPFYTEDDGLASDLATAALTVHDPLWRMPLWQPYAAGLESKVADLCHTSSDGFAGSVTAALFLQKFVSQAKCWAHFDIYAWNAKPKPGRKIGGEAQAIRTIFKVLCDRYPK